MYRLVAIVLVCFFCFSFSWEKLVKVKIGENITLKVPESFFAMSEQDMNQRYRSHRLPLALYTDPTRTAEFGVNRSYSKWMQSDMPLLKEFYHSSLMNLYSEVEFIQEDIVKVNNRFYVIFEFISTVKPNDDDSNLRPVSKYTYLAYTLDNNNTYLFNFTCPKGLKDQWQETAHEIMGSIKFK